MTEGIPVVTEFLVLDRDERLLHDLTNLVQGQCGPRPVASFANVEQGRAYLAELPPSSLCGPRILITDWIGLRPNSDGKHFVDHVRGICPLTLVILHSRQAASRPESVEELLKQRLVQSTVVKGSRDSLLNTVKHWVEQSEQPFAQRFRDYIVCRGAKAHFLFLDDGLGGYLSLTDLYREIILETALGRKAKVVWARILAARPLTVAVATGQDGG